MNILIFSWRGPKHPNAGGAEIVTREHAKAWVKKGHKVTLFTSLFKSAPKKEIVDGIKIIRGGNGSIKVQLRAFWWYLFGQHDNFDLVIDEFHGLPFFTPLFVKAKKLAFIHEVTKEVWRMNPWPKPLNLIPWVLGSVFEPWIFRLLYNTVPFMTVSNSTKSDLINWGIPKENITVINNGVITPKVKKEVTKEKKETIVFLGALSKDKGIEDAITAFHYIKQSGGNFQFWIIGKSSSKYRDFLRTQKQRLGLNKSLKYWGYVDENKKFELLKKAHVLINPSIREGWGLVVIEAASVGTPTVGYNVAGLRDSIIHNKTGILCQINPKYLADQAIGLLKDDSGYTKMIANCLRWSQQFSWDKSTQKSLKLIKNL